MMDIYLLVAAIFFVTCLLVGVVLARRDKEFVDFDDVSAWFFTSLAASLLWGLLAPLGAVFGAGHGVAYLLNLGKKT